MCQQLVQLYQYVRDNQTTATMGDVIRVACSSCQKVDVCAAVTGREFDHHEQRDNSSPATG